MSRCFIGTPADGLWPREAVCPETLLVARKYEIVRCGDMNSFQQILPPRYVARFLLLALICAVGWRPLAAESRRQVEVILWFDTEDYLLPADDDAAKRLAE